MRAWLGLLLVMLPGYAMAAPSGGETQSSGFYCVGPAVSSGVACNKLAGPVGGGGAGVPQTGCILADVGVCLLADTGVKLLVQ
jgi:hypothetical protein